MVRFVGISEPWLWTNRSFQQQMSLEHPWGSGFGSAEVPWQRWSLYPQRRRLSSPFMIHCRLGIFNCHVWWHRRVNGESHVLDDLGESPNCFWIHPDRIIFFYKLLIFDPISLPLFVVISPCFASDYICCQSWLHCPWSVSNSFGRWYSICLHLFRVFFPFFSTKLLNC